MIVEKSEVSKGVEIEFEVKMIFNREKRKPQSIFSRRSSLLRLNPIEIP